MIDGPVTELSKKGYLVLPFPSDLSKTMRGSIFGRLREVGNVTFLCDEDFYKLFGKPFRLFPDEISYAALKWLQQFSGLLGASAIGTNFVSQHERNNNPALTEKSLDIFWRIVRPGKPDVGPPHTDEQFWRVSRGTEHDPGLPFKYDERWRVWLPLLGCDKTNSLQVIPGSHLEDVPIDLSQTIFGWRHPIEAGWLADHEDKFFCPFTQFNHFCILFHDRLVHRGPPNNTDGLRLSAELTVLVKK